MYLILNNIGGESSLMGGVIAKETKLVRVENNYKIPFCIYSTKTIDG